MDLNQENQEHGGQVSPEGPGEFKKPTVIAFISIKGGVGKSRGAILTANCLGAAGKRVLIIDMDHNNSTTYYYLADLPDGAEKEILT
ncbi:MAG: ParA family protein, partial [Treponema sp.]|nr:ParA family protein [Treponema sp.]